MVEDALHDGWRTTEDGELAVGDGGEDDGRMGWITSDLDDLFREGLKDGR